MSTRWYPIYQRGNPQLRIFLPNFWMKLVRPEHKQPENVVQFITPTQMSDHDIKQYLEKIYKVEVASVRSQIKEGLIKRQRLRGYIIKEPDYRQAFITLPPGQTFKFPDISTEKEKQDDNEIKKFQETASQAFEKFKVLNKDRPGVPGWFSL
uniref:Large ribosomal subunit protein uL23m n=1 Tax=Lygus hesperus TaxID=30085 RepID=A0A0A9WQJ2_LYGHE